MKLGFKFGFALWLLCTAVNCAAQMPRSSDDQSPKDSAQADGTTGIHLASASQASRHGSTKGLLSADQGRALVDFAMDSAADLRSHPDCSHFVHLVYSDAGLTYAYQDSRVLRSGVPEFKRVKKPQPGDLVVWPGHVGMVVSPKEKTFFSSVRSGIITESWTAAHWRARGRPRFFRYRVGPDTDLTQLATTTDDDSR
jgi:cell wall-associated NlpC family hydrolase